MSKKQEGRKITLPPQRKSQIKTQKSIVLLPELQSVLDDASHIVGTELAKMRNRSDQSTAPMDPETARLFQGYVKSAVDLSKEARERDKEDSTGDLSDKELLDLFLDSMPKEDVVRLLQDKINSQQDAKQDPEPNKQDPEPNKQDPKPTQQDSSVGENKNA